MEARDDEALSTPELKKLASKLGYTYLEDLPQISELECLLEGNYSRVLGSWGKQNKIIPFYEDAQFIHIAIANPYNIRALDALRSCFTKRFKIFFCGEEHIMRVINNARTSLMSSRSGSLDSSDKDNSDDDIATSLKIDVTDAEDDDAPIIRYVNTLIFRAANQRASDIHIEPFEENLKVRFRIDGVLQDIDTEDKTFQSAILSRIKVMANLNIAEKRLPQDGRIGIRIAGQDVDIRVSTVPTRYGERIVMRLLDKATVMLELKTLGLSEQNTQIINRVIHKNHGIILATGPTGSGKTTTLYACLTSINSVDKNILTVEDPIEYEISGIGQMQVNPKINFTFATGLRSILRQDPDVIMVGEIRDLETVEIAIQASLTGHLVFSTLHTNDAPGSITRLLDMGVEPFLIASSLIVVVAQRLIRKLCPECKVPYTLSEAQLLELSLEPARVSIRQAFRASEQGCPACQLTGYKGRSGIHEILTIDDAVRAEIMKRSDANTIRAAATNLVTLRRDGALKVLSGETSFEEVIRVTHEDLG